MSRWHVEPDDGLNASRGIVFSILVGAVLWLAILGGISIARAATQGPDSTRLRYVERGGGDGPDVIIRGRGCGLQEDSWELHLVRGGYLPDGFARPTVILRCSR